MYTYVWSGHVTATCTCTTFLSGRTGRVCDGTVIRMMTKQEYESRDAFDKPEMLQSPLDKLVLQVKHVSKKLSPDTRPSELLQQAIQEQLALGASSRREARLERWSRFT